MREFKLDYSTISSLNTINRAINTDSVAMLITNLNPPNDTISEQICCRKL